MPRATTSAVRRDSSTYGKRSASSRSYNLLRHMLALLLVGALLLPPSTFAAHSSLGGASLTSLRQLGSRFNSNFAAMLSLFGLVQSGQPGRGKRPTPERPLPPRIAPGPPPTKAEREARVARLEVGTQGLVRLEPGQRMHLGTVPLDAHGDAVHGLVAEWESSSPAVASVTALGWVTALQPGTAQLTATAGNKRATVPVTVEEPETMAEEDDAGVAARERAGGVQFVKASLARRARPRSSDAARHARGAASVRAASVRAALVQGPSGEGPLPDAEAESLYSPENDVGAPRGRTEPGAIVAPAAVAGTETPLSANFMFGISLTGAPTRGSDLGLALTYNSRLWHRSTDSGGVTRLTYNADSSWMAPGFTIGFGEIEPHGTFFTLREADGTRRKLAQVSGQIYETGDGTFIRYEGSTLSGQLTYPNGTRVNYQAMPSSSSPTGYLKRLTPVSFTDRNGNYSDVVIYSSGGRARVSSFRDSMGRYTRFRYDYGNNDLVAMTAPGYAGGGDRLVARFYYEDLPINASFQLPTRAPGTARVLRYVYFDTDGIGTGYRFDYSSYGMIYRIKMLRGMTISYTEYDQTGAVTGEGQTAATTEYNYPTGPSNLADAPQFTRRTDDWSSRTTGMGGTMEAPYHVFAVNQSQGVSTITAPDGSLSETRVAVNPGQWDDGAGDRDLRQSG
ncbi:MAG: Ig-like domain-containing protein [Acidobacteriota bacterium]|nr:Ig-like domain-containing protein [Acidobacteriota bacterium]